MKHLLYIIAIAITLSSCGNKKTVRRIGVGKINIGDSVTYWMPVKLNDGREVNLKVDYDTWINTSIGSDVEVTLP